MLYKIYVATSNGEQNKKKHQTSDLCKLRKGLLRSECHNLLIFFLFFIFSQIILLVPISMLLASIYLVVAPITTDPWGSLIALVVIVAGLPFYWLFIGSDVAPKFILDAAGKGFIFLRNYSFELLYSLQVL